MATLSTKLATRVPAASPQAVIPVTPRNVNSPTYNVTMTHACQMVARGSAVWIPGLKRLREVQPLAVRGELREWCPTACYDPDTGVSIRTLQLVVPTRDRQYITRQPKTRTNSKRKPVNRLLYRM